MVLKVVRKEGVFRLEDGKYEGFGVLRRVTGGHPNGITAIETSKFGSTVLVHTAVAVSRRAFGEIENPISILRMTRGVKVTTGQLSGQELAGNTTVIDLLGKGAEATIRSQGEEMTFRHLQGRIRRDVF